MKCKMKEMFGVSRKYTKTNADGLRHQGYSLKEVVQHES